MHIVKLDATDSTNQFLKENAVSKNYIDFTVVTAKKQLKARGQRGSEWQSESGKNLTFSVLKNNVALLVNNQFLLNIYISLAIFDLLKSLSVPDLSIKWPNDILSGNFKICGILIENILQGNKITNSIIGVGLNVNQITFDNLSNVSSLKLLLGRSLNLDELLHGILRNIENIFLNQSVKNDKIVWATYEEHLFRKNKPSTFKDAEGNFFMGFIRNISPEGQLVVELEDAIFKEFGLKEVKLLY